MLSRYVRQLIFIQIVNALKLHFQGQIFESSTFGSSHVIIPKTATDGTNIAIANIESLIGIRLFGVC